MALLATVGMLSCQSEPVSFENNNPSMNSTFEEDPTTVYVKEIINSATSDYDREELMAELKSKVFVVCEEYSFSGNKWREMLSNERGIALEDDSCYTYRFVGVVGFEDYEPTTLECIKYEYTVLDSKDFLTFQFKSQRGADDDFLVAKVIDFKDDTVIIEGLLPLNDGTGIVPNHRLYIGSLDPDRRAEWDSILESQE